MMYLSSTSIKYCCWLLNLNIDLEGTQNTQQEEIMIDGGGNRNNANVSQEIQQSLNQSDI